MTEWLDREMEKGAKTTAQGQNSVGTVLEAPAPLETSALALRCVEMGSLLEQSNVTTTARITTTGAILHARLLLAGIA